MKNAYFYYLLILSVLIICPIVDNAWARQDSPPKSWALISKALDEVDIYQLPAVDRADALAKAQILQGAGPVPFAIPHDISLSPETAGTWTDLTDGSRIWRLRFHAAGATDFNFGFTGYHLPAGAELHIYSEDLSYYQGAYTSRDNKPHGELWTPVVPTSEAVVELFLPAGSDDKVLLEFGRVGAGFRDLFGRYEGPVFSLAKQGACNNDVICSVGNPWRDEIRSVAAYGSNGFVFCTGTLVGDVPGTFRPFFLTADHCDVGADSAASVVVYWNFESSSCGALSGGSLAQNQTGATLRADRADVDMTLLELDALPDPAFNVYYAGWDASGTVPQGSVGIHHPSGDEKAISFNDDALTTTASCILTNSTPNTHWRVDNWEDGTTEPGSSGSGLWDPAAKRLVGFLSGGTAACNNQQGFDCYGKFSVAWNGPTAGQRLKDWLDPAASGALAVDGSDPGGFSLSVAPSGAQICAPGTTGFTIQTSAVSGFTTPITLSTPGLPAAVSSQFSVNPLTPGNGSQLTLTAAAGASAGTYGITVQGSAGQNNASQQLTLNVLGQVAAPVLTAPADNADAVSSTPLFSWSSVAQATGYRIEISTDAGFNTIVDTALVTGNSYQPAGALMAQTTYFWRVRSRNTCGESANSGVFSFTTTTADTLSSAPDLSIPDDNDTGSSDTLPVSLPGILTDLNVTLDISHTYVGDLKVTLTHTDSAISVVLIDRPGVPASTFGCSGNDIAAVLDDSAAQSVENECAASVPAISGTFRPAEPLSAFNGQSLAGNWRLTISDNSAQDTGILRQWSLQPRTASSNPALIFEDGFEN